jgi:hypothetical protein
MAIRLETSLRRGIENHKDVELTHVDLNWAADIAASHPKARPRTSPSAAYNCHGLTFASRRTRIIKNSALTAILEDDTYKDIDLQDAMPGDIVIYQSDDGDLNHSGIVVEAGPPLVVPMICSKWGNAGEFVHGLRDCPAIYGPVTKFYRCRR